MLSFFRIVACRSIRLLSYNFSTNVLFCGLGFDNDLVHDIENRYFIEDIWIETMNHDKYIGLLGITYLLNYYPCDYKKVINSIWQSKPDIDTWINLPTKYLSYKMPYNLLQYSKYQNVLFFEPYYPYGQVSLAIPTFFPITVIGVVIPVTSFEVKNFGEQAIVNTLNMFGERFKLPILVICIDCNQETMDILQSLNNKFQLRNFNSQDTSLIQQVIPDFIIQQGHTLNKASVQPIETGKLPVIGLPDTYISPNAIGIGEHISQLFVTEIARSLVRQDEEFKLWIDIGIKPTQNISNRQDYLDVRVDDYSLLFDGIPIATPSLTRFVKENTFQFLVKPAYHLYIEYKNHIYDCFRGLNGDYSLKEFQSKINSHKRRYSQTIVPTADMAYTLSCIQNLLGEVK